MRDGRVLRRRRAVAALVVIMTAIVANPHVLTGAFSAPVPPPTSVLPINNPPPPPPRRIGSIHRSIPTCTPPLLLKIVYPIDDVDVDNDAPPNNDSPSFPVILFLSGADCPHEGYMWLASRLAREGCCVVLSSCVVAFGGNSKTCLLSLPYDMSALTTVEEYKKGPSSVGLSTLLDELHSMNSDAYSPMHGKLDMSKLVVGGHSSGGRTALDLVAYDAHHDLDIMAVFTYGASLVNSGPWPVARGEVVPCDDHSTTMTMTTTTTPSLLLMGGSRDGISATLSPDGNDATYTLRRTMDDGFSKRRNVGGGDVDLVVIKGSNHMVFCHPVDGTCGATAADWALEEESGCDGDTYRNYLGDAICDYLRSRSVFDTDAAPSTDRVFRPNIPSRLLHIAKSYRASDDPRISHIVSSINDEEDANDVGGKDSTVVAWEQLSLALEIWISKFVADLGLVPYRHMPDSASRWTTDDLHLIGSLEAWTSPDVDKGSLVAWAVRYTTTDISSGRRSLGMNVWLGNGIDVPHLTIYVGVGGSAATLMADHLPRVDLAMHPEYATRHYGDTRAVYWSEVRKRPGITPFVSMDPTVRGIQGPNTLALRTDLTSGGEDGLTSLVEALNDHCSAWLDTVRDAPPALDAEERKAVTKRDTMIRACLRDHECDAGKRVMDADFALFLANCMTGIVD
jgi:hypothetical protein